MIFFFHWCFLLLDFWARAMTHNVSVQIAARPKSSPNRPKRGKAPMDAWGLQI